MVEVVHNPHSHLWAEGFFKIVLGRLTFGTGWRGGAHPKSQLVYSRKWRQEADKILEATTKQADSYMLFSLL